MIFGLFDRLIRTVRNRRRWGLLVANAERVADYATALHKTQGAAHAKLSTRSPSRRRRST